MKARGSIIGYVFELEVGVRYYASRPALKFGRKAYPVSIRTLTGVEPVVVVGGLTYENANDLVNAFNYEQVSYKGKGRVW